MIRPEDIEADFWDALPLELRKELLAARAPAVKRITTAKSSQQATLFKFGVSAEIDLTKERSPVKEKDGTSPKRGTKQPKLTSRAGDGLGIQGLDFGASEANSFTDLDFKPIPASIDGISLTVEQSHDETGKATERKSGSANNCLCGNPVKFQRVQKAGPNQGRLFKACAKPYNLSGRCNFFAWATSADEGFVHKESVTALSWARFESSSGFRMTPSNGRFKPEAILQGRVGDCWFLSAVAIVSLREDLCTKIVCNYPAIPDDGKLTFNLFIDGCPRQVVVDNYLPIKTTESVSLGKRGRKQSRGVDALEFSNCGENSCMWVPFLEKAYAKAHGSYHAISGGWIHEALFDLTGAPCLELDFSSLSFDSEATWTLLSSYHAARYPLGCSTSFSSKGIVGHHAYSVLEVEELPVEECAGLLGMQASIKAFATTTATTTTASGPAGGTVNSLLEQEAKFSVHLSAHGSLRLLRIRNPWGRQSFSGDFSHSSEFWTATMRRRLTQGTKDDGTFWMSYHDFLAHFTSVDVCLADASGGCVGRSLEDTTCSSPDYRTQGLAVELAPPAHHDGHVYVTVVQRTLRGAGHNSDIKARAGQNHAISPINHFACMVAVYRMGEDRGFSLELCRTMAPGRTSEPVQVLLRGGCRYRVQVMHLDLDSKPAPFVVRLYGPGNIVATASQVRLSSSSSSSSSSTGAGAADMDEGERSIVRSLAQCYLSSPHQAGRHSSPSPLSQTHGLFVERDSVLDAGMAGSGRRYHLTHLTSVDGGGRDVSLLLLLCSSPVSTASSDGQGEGEAASVRVILRTANRLVLSPFLVPGSARHAVATPEAAEDSSAVHSTSSLSPSPSPSSSTSRRTRESRKKELFTERTLAVPLVPHTARIVAVVVRAVGGGDATGGNTRKTQQGHSNSAGRVLPVAVAHKLFEESPSSMQSLLAALPRALPLYEGVPLSAQFQAKVLGVGEQGNKGASRAGDRVIINLE